MTAPKFTVVRRSLGELSDAEILEFFDFGAREGELIDELEEAVRDGDRARAWEIAEQITANADANRRG